MWLGVMLILLVTLTGLFAYYQERKSCSIMESFLDLIPQVSTQPFSSILYRMSSNIYQAISQL